MNTHFPKTTNNQWIHRPFLQGLVMLLVLVLIAGLAIAPHFPRGFTPSSAPNTDFSAERAMQHLPVIAKQPHPAGSPAQAELREYLLQRLAALGLETETQPFDKYENVVARLRGSQSTGAIVILAHYDSVRAGPGAADNGAGVAALLEIMRALVNRPQLRNDVIALFDDAEEGPHIFGGTKAFVSGHPWMADVRVAIGMDTAVQGPIMVDDISSPNGRLVQVLADAYRINYVWNSVSGGGNYDSLPFRMAGIQVLELEDNYPFWWQHTTLDQVENVSVASLQQLGEQALAVASRLGDLDLRQPWGAQQAFFSVPLLGFIHYPQSRTLPLSIAAAVFTLITLILTLRMKIVHWRGLVVGLLAFILTPLVIALVAGAIWSRLPKLLSWQTYTWPMWSEVIPPNGGIIFIAFGLLAMGLAVLAYWLSRRVGSRADLALVGLFPFVILALAFAITDPRTALLPLWPALVGSLGWLLVLAFTKNAEVVGDLPAWIDAVVILVFVPFVIIATYQGSGLDSIVLIAGFWAIFTLSVLPAFEAAFTRMLSPNPRKPI